MPPPMMPPGGGTPSNGQQGRSNSYGQSLTDHANATARSVFVRPYSGLGVPADFDPETGALRPAAIGVDPPAGVYAEMGDVTVILYRYGGELSLRVGDRVIDVGDRSIAVEWELVERRRTRLTVRRGGTDLCRLDYQSLPAELDLGVLIRDVCADPARRASIFTR